MNIYVVISYFISGAVFLGYLLFLSREKQRQDFFDQLSLGGDLNEK